MRHSSIVDHDFDSLPTIHDAPNDTKAISGERALWISVICNCWADAFNRLPISVYSTDRDCDPAFEIAEARRWLTLNFGNWKSDREHCCDLAGIEPEMLRNAAKAKLAEVKTAEAENRKAKVLSLDRAFAALLESEATMDAKALDKALEALAALESSAA